MREDGAAVPLATHQIAFASMSLIAVNVSVMLRDAFARILEFECVFVVSAKHQGLP